MPSAHDIPQPLVPGDDGAADRAVVAALTAFQQEKASAADVLAALAAARLLVPVVAVLTESETGDDGLRREKSSDMALPKLVGRDGREAVLAFTGSESLRLWRADARPIQATGPQVCQAALHERAAAVVVDVAGPVPFTLEGAALQTLAAIADPAARDSLGTRLRVAPGSRLRRVISRFRPVR
ncbi:SseB family protein [Streptosporangiaceae bacterium NEAU-GS5]|nr:SseB family protein [Streptosporangiaceae bacterium NEAU-GS5]